jgi:hypothetical protein
VPTPLRNEVSETAGRICPRIVPKEADEVPCIASVRGQCALDDAAVDFHPLEEPLDQSDRLGSGLDDRDDSPLTEMLEESADTREGLSGVIAGGAWARARQAVPFKHLEGRFVDRFQTAMLALDPDAEVRDGVEIESGNPGVVPGPEESPLVFTEEVPEDSRADGRQSQHLPGVVDTHMVPPWGVKNACPGEKLSAEAGLLRVPERADHAVFRSTQGEKLRIVFSSR